MAEITYFTRVTLPAKDMCLPFHFANLFLILPHYHILPEFLSPMIEPSFYS